MRRPTIRQLLVGLNVLVIMVPALSILFLRLYDDELIQRTEGELIAQSVVVGEAFRDAWHEAQGLARDLPPAARPPHATDERYAPIEPVLTRSGGVLPAETPPPLTTETRRDGPTWVAGARLTALLERAKLQNLSAVRVLDPRGCVVATTGADLGACVANLPEVEQALAGRYGAVLRERISDEPAPALGSISRRGDARVFVALPVFSDGQVVAVVRASRTAIDPLKAIWLQGDTVLLSLIVALALLVAVSLFFAHAISRPMRTITAVAERIARSERHQPFALSGVVPAEVEALRAALEQMSRNLSDRAEYIAEFAATVSHELKTPLTGIRGAIELLGDSWAEMSEAERRRFLTNVDGDAARLQALASRLLELARVQSAPEQSETVAVAPFLRQLAARYGEQVRLELDAPPAAIDINPQHLASAVGNLLDNAVRHGAGEPVILRAGAHGGRLELAVTDRGPGILPAHRARIFERFFTTERDRGGTGLGLSIVRAVAETRGGSVAFTSGAEGTTFVLRL